MLSRNIYRKGRGKKGILKIRNGNVSFFRKTEKKIEKKKKKTSKGG